MKIINKIIQFLFGFLFFSVPLFFLFNTSELFEFNKMLLIYGLTTIIGFFWILKMILAKKIIIKKTFLDIPIILFLISQILSTVFSIDVHTSIFGYYGRFNGGLLSIISYIFLYYAFVSNNVDPNPIFKVSLISSFLTILYAIPGKLGRDITCFLASNGKIFDNSCWDNSVLQFQPDVRAFSTLGQPNWFGAYLALNFFIGIYYLIKHQTSNIKYQISIKNFLIIFYLFLNFSFILFTRSRSAILAVLISITLFIIYYLLFIKKNINRLFISLLIIFIIPIFLFKTGVNKIDKFLEFSILNFKSKDKKISNYQPPTINHQPLNITDSADIRKIVWKGAVNLGLKYPLFGTGVETFAYSYNFVRPIEHNYISEWDFVYNKAHNEYLNYFATTGFIGLINYLALIITTIYFFISNIKYQISNINIKNKKENILKFENHQLFFIFLFLSYITILITNFFGFSTTTINLYFYLIPAFIISLKEDKKKNIDFNIDNFSFSQFILILLSVFIVFYLLFSVFNYYKADIYYSLGNSYLKLNNPNYQISAYYFDKALKIRNEHVYQDKLSFSLAYLSALASLQKESTVSSNLIRLSDYYNNQSILSSPKNIFYWKTKAKNYYYYYLATSDTNYLHEAIKILIEAKKLAPTDPKIPYNLVLFYKELEKNEKDINKKNYFKNKAKEEINNTLFLKKDYDEAKNLLNY